MSGLISLIISNHFSLQFPSQTLPDTGGPGVPSLLSPLSDYTLASLPVEKS